MRLVQGAIVACVIFAVATNLVLYGGVAVARVRGDDTRSTNPVIPSIQNLRSAGGELWVGDQPRGAGYRDLVQKLGVKRVVNFRTGDGTDPEGDDGRQLAELGIEYVRLPLHDGHAPDEATVQRFLQLVRESPGPVFAHCGGGVGRSSVMESAFRAAQRQDPSVLNQFLLGPISLEQAWFIARVGDGKTTVDDGAATRLLRTVSRVIDFPRPYFSWLARQLR